MIKENSASSPMLFVSRQDNINDKEVNYVPGTTGQQYRCVYISSSTIKGAAAFSDGPPFWASGQNRHRRWSYRNIIFQAILMAYDPSSTLKDRFGNARQCLTEMFANQRRPGKTYQGFVKALGQVSARMRQSLQDHLCREHQQVAGSGWKLLGWIPFAVDGSRVELPRSRANEAALGCAGRKKTGPQFLVTVLYHMCSGLPWGWKISSGKGSERGDLRGMLGSLPSESLLVADAGFTGYELLKDISAHQLSFLIRVGANVTLLTGLGFELRRQGNVVWLWPQAKRDQHPLKLRLIRLRIKAKCSGAPKPVYLLTNVFDRGRFCDNTAGAIYKMRWGVEVFFRSFKQTLERRKLCSRSPQLAQEELHWSLTALFLLGLMGVDALRTQRREPLKLSAAESLRVVRWAMVTDRRWRFAGDLRCLLAKAVKDSYPRCRSKNARDWPHKKNPSPPGVPKIRPANPNEIHCAERIYSVA